MQSAHVLILLQHEKLSFLAAKQIGQSSFGTWDKGMVLHPTNENCLGAYINSNFAGSLSKNLALMALSPFLMLVLL